MRRGPASVPREIALVRGSLSALDRSLRRLATMLSQLDGRIERRRKPRVASRKPLSAKARASLKLQGRHMGYMRQLKPRQKVVERDRPVEELGRNVNLPLLSFADRFAYSVASAHPADERVSNPSMETPWRTRRKRIIARRSSRF